MGLCFGWIGIWNQSYCFGERHHFFVLYVAGSSDTESQYPFYKRLASVFHESVTSTASCGAFSNIASLNEDDDLKKREDWGKLVLKEGSEMIEVCICVDFHCSQLSVVVSMYQWWAFKNQLLSLHQLLKTVNFELHVQEPYFTQLKGSYLILQYECVYFFLISWVIMSIHLKAIDINLILFVDGLKTVEGRCAVGDYNRYIPISNSHMLCFMFIGVGFLQTLLSIDFHNILIFSDLVLHS